MQFKYINQEFNFANFYSAIVTENKSILSNGYFVSFLESFVVNVSGNAFWPHSLHHKSNNINVLWYSTPWSQNYFCYSCFWKWQHRWNVTNAKKMGMENAIRKMMLALQKTALIKVFVLWSSMNTWTTPTVSLFLETTFALMNFWLDMRYCKEDTKLKLGYQCIQAKGRKIGYACNEDLCNGNNTSRFLYFDIFDLKYEFITIFSHSQWTWQ